MKSPIEIMIDEACEVDPEGPSVNEIAETIANDLVFHIDEMYPDMWVGVPKTARISIKNMVINKVNLWFDVLINNQRSK